MDKKPNIAELLSAFHKRQTTVIKGIHRVADYASLVEQANAELHADLEKLGVAELFDWTIED